MQSAKPGEAKAQVKRAKKSATTSAKPGEAKAQVKSAKTSAKPGEAEA